MDQNFLLIFKKYNYEIKTDFIFVHQRLILYVQIQFVKQIRQLSFYKHYQLFFYYLLFLKIKIIMNVIFLKIAKSTRQLHPFRSFSILFNVQRTILIVGYGGGLPGPPLYQHHMSGWAGVLLRWGPLETTNKISPHHRVRSTLLGLEELDYFYLWRIKLTGSVRSPFILFIITPQLLRGIIHQLHY